MQNISGRVFILIDHAWINNIYIYIIYIVKFPPVDEDMIKKTAIEAKGWQRVTLSDQSDHSVIHFNKLLGKNPRLGYICAGQVLR